MARHKGKNGLNSKRVVADENDSPSDDDSPLLSRKKKQIKKDKASDITLECAGSRLSLAAKKSTSMNIMYRDFHRIHDGISIRHQTNLPLKAVKMAAIRQVNRLKVFKVYRPFDRRVTFLLWHPKLPTTLAVGSKGGDIILWDYEKPKHEAQINGCGPGGSIQAMKFDVNDPSMIYTASITGTVCKQDFQGKRSQVFLDTENRDHWFTSLDVSFTGKTMLAGDNKGYVQILTVDGQRVSQIRLHKQKVTHAEFNPREPWLITTASVDNTVKLWDVRNVKERADALQVLEHVKPVNSAYFSTAHGNRLLTTDQHSEIRVYEGPLWDLRRIIPHPHRQFQHLTPIKAFWHPLEDIIIAGRYPDPAFPGYTKEEPRSVDFFDADTGEILTQIVPDVKSGIISLNRCDNIGMSMASGMGFEILIWKPAYPDSKATEEDCQPMSFKGVLPEVPKRRAASSKSKKLD